MMKLEIKNQLSAALNMPWKKTITVGRAYDLIRHDTLEHLRYLQKEVGYEYIRFHALFHDDMGVVKRREDGSLSFQWHHVDKIYDALLDMGLKPFIELNSMPAALASGDTTMFFYKMNVTPPKDYSEWAMLIEKFTEHIVDRYGLEEVRTWFFEVWNEPNLRGFWDTGNPKEEYFKLYDAAALAIKDVDPLLKVGGPATAIASWIGDTIEHCSETNIPIDFISTHVYQLDEPLKYGDLENSPGEVGEFVIDTFKEVQKIVKESAIPDLEIHWTEWNAQTATSKSDVTFMDNEAMDNLYGGAMVARHCMELDNACNSMAYWAASDIFEEHPISNSPFSCSYGLVTQVGIPKATANAFRLMSKLKGQKMKVDLTDSAPHGCGAVITKELKTVHGFLYNHLFVGMDSREQWDVEVKLNLENSGDYVLTIAHVKVGAGSVKELWVDMGSPQNLSKIQEQALRTMAEPEYTCKPIAGVNSVEFDLSLASNELLYFELRPAEKPSVSKSQEMNLEKLNKQLFTDNVEK